MFMRYRYKLHKSLSLKKILVSLRNEEGNEYEEFDLVHVFSHTWDRKPLHSVPPATPQPPPPPQPPLQLASLGTPKHQHPSPTTSDGFSPPQASEDVSISFPAAIGPLRFMSGQNDVC